MEAYYVIFTLKGIKICGCWKRANGKEEAMTTAAFALACHYSNVEYDDCYIANVRD